MNKKEGGDGVDSGKEIRENLKQPREKSSNKSHPFCIGLSRRLWWGRCPCGYMTQQALEQMPYIDSLNFPDKPSYDSIAICNFQ